MQSVLVLTLKYTVSALKEMVNKCRSKTSSVFMCFIHAFKAFGHVSHRKSLLKIKPERSPKTHRENFGLFVHQSNYGGKIRKQYFNPPLVSQMGSSKVEICPQSLLMCIWTTTSLQHCVHSWLCLSESCVQTTLWLFALLVLACCVLYVARNITLSTMQLSS